jgi:hypothetical protein
VVPIATTIVAVVVLPIPAPTHAITAGLTVPVLTSGETATLLRQATKQKPPSQTCAAAARKPAIGFPPDVSGLQKNRIN